MASHGSLPADTVPSFEESVTAHWSNAYQPRVEFYRSIIDSRHSSAKAPSEDLRQIRRESSIIKAQHALLNECENALLPVSRLAPEILSRVFHFLAQDLPLVPDDAEKLDHIIYKRRSDKKNPHPLRKSWTKVLFVSRHFRRTALSDPSLWPAVTTALGQQWMNKLVDLSGSSPITFHLGARYDGMKKAVRAALLKVIDRTRSLQITSNSKGLRALVLPTFQLPELRKIRFHMEDDEEESSTDGEDTVPSWNSDVLARVTAPALQELFIHGFGDFPWVSTLLQPSLTTLHIGVDAEPAYDLVDLYSFKTLLAALSRLPRLAELSLKRCQVKVLHSGLAPVSMPLLRKVRLEHCEYMLVAYAFAHLQVPQEAKLYFSTDMQRFNDPPGSFLSQHHQISPLFFSTLKQHLATPTWQNVHTVECITKPEMYPEMYSGEASTVEDEDYDDYEDQAFVINVWRLDDPRIVCADCERVPRPKKSYFDTAYDYVRYERPEPDLTISMYQGHRQSFRFSDECLGLFAHSPSVHALSLRPAHKSWTLGDWPNSPTSFVNVRFLRVDGVLGQDILEKLYDLGVGQDGAAGSGSTHLPQLKSLALLRDGEYVKWRSRPASTGLADRLELLVKTWEVRAANSVPLQEVILDERRCALSHFQSVRKLINIRPIHLWDFGSYEPILSEEEDEEEDDEDDGPDEDEDEMYDYY